MNSRNSNALNTSSAEDGDGIQSVNGKRIVESGDDKGSPEVDQLSRDMADTNIDSYQESAGKVIQKKSIATGPESWGSSATGPEFWNSAERVANQGSEANGGWGKSLLEYRAQDTDSRMPGDRDNSMPEPSKGDLKSKEEIVSNYFSQKGSTGGYDTSPDTMPYHSDDDSSDDESREDPDDDLSDHYDSDASQKSHELRKRNWWFRAFFKAMDSLTIEEINDQTRRWHCPACQDGPGAISWYKGLNPLMTHAKTKRSSRVKLHREFAELLDEELERRGAKLIGEAFSRLKGLHESTSDLEIVWPPMVVILSTLLKKADSDEWFGISTRELREYFKECTVVNAHHSYGPNREMSVLIFEASAMGYWEAKHLHKHFMASGRGRDAWEQSSMKAFPSAGCNLYGFLARKDDMDIFYQHSQGKLPLKFEMRSYQKMIVIPMRQMGEANQILLLFKNKVVQQQQVLKSLEEILGEVGRRNHKKTEEDRSAKLITKNQLDECKEEKETEEQLLKETIDSAHKVTEKLQECTTGDDRSKRKEERACSVKNLVNSDEEIDAKMDRLIGAYEAKKANLKQKHLEEQQELEEEFATNFAKFLEEHTL